MAYNPKKLINLFIDTAKKAGLTLEHSDAELLAEEINNYGEKPRVSLTGKFIYEAQRKIKVAIKNEEESIAFSPTYINRLAQFLDLRDFSQYEIESKEDLNTGNKKNNKQTLRNDNNQTTIIGKNINKIEGDINNGIINNN
ncbi:hypothetical protein [Kordia jejudonensis]|uniref:hypothetical protein n=1 Tax=Kordia jejudonensis TaxID=1348245 RepID=UPI00062991D7|nr:hypothetical protein [Kordia jejudonensis]